MKTTKFKLSNVFTDGNVYAKWDIIALFVLIMVVVFLCIENSDASQLNNSLKRQGYDLEGIEFERLENKWWEAPVYLSSEPLPLENGEMCDKWQIVSWGSIGYARYVLPYPRGAWPPAQVTVNISLNAEEYMQVEELAGDIPIDVYIRESLLEHLREDGV